jgi:hypothetical protein
MMQIHDIARVTHEANRAWCVALGDLSQVPWDEAPDWQRQSALDGVQFHLANPGAGPDNSHNCWLAEKERDGWVYGEVKDPTAKTHPCIVPFEQLPPEQQAKDRLFSAIVRALAPTPPADDFEDTAPQPRGQVYARTSTGAAMPAQPISTTEK